jgi:hypothetical protein
MVPGVLFDQTGIRNNAQTINNRQLPMYSNSLATSIAAVGTMIDVYNTAEWSRLDTFEYQYCATLNSTMSLASCPRCGDTFNITVDCPFILRRNATFISPSCTFVDAVPYVLLGIDFDTINEEMYVAITPYVEAVRGIMVSTAIFIVVIIALFIVKGALVPICLKLVIRLRAVRVLQYAGNYSHSLCSFQSTPTKQLIFICTRLIYSCVSST